MNGFIPCIALDYYIKIYEDSKSLFKFQRIARTKKSEKSRGYRFLLKHRLARRTEFPTWRT